MRYEYVLSVLPKKIRSIISKENIEISTLMEIRIRENKPLIVICDNKEMEFDDSEL